MYKKMIREWLVSNKFGVYALIASRYYDQLEELKPSFFRQWLAEELQIEKEKICINNLYAALSRQRRKMKKTGKENKTAFVNSENTSSASNVPFHFSKDDGPPQKQNLLEF